MYSMKDVLVSNLEERIFFSHKGVSERVCPVLREA